MKNPKYSPKTQKIRKRGSFSSGPRWSDRPVDGAHLLGRRGRPESRLTHSPRPRCLLLFLRLTLADHVDTDLESSNCSSVVEFAKKPQENPPNFTILDGFSPLMNLKVFAVVR